MAKYFLKNTLHFLIYFSLLFSFLSPRSQPFREKFVPVVQAATPIGMISFVRNGELWVSAPDGTQARQLTNLGGGVVFPEWSPDNLRIAFVHNLTIDGKATSEIRVYDFATNQSLVVLPAEKTPFLLLGTYYAYTTPKWSPDKKTLYYIAWDGRASGSIVHKIDTQTGTRDSGFTPFISRGLDVNPIDGRLVINDYSNAYVVGDLLWIASSSGQIISTAVPLQQDQRIAPARWTADGTRIGFFASGGSFGSLGFFSILPNGTDRHSYHPSGVSNLPFFDWSLDGNSIAYEAGTDNRWFSLSDDTENGIGSGAMPSWAQGYGVTPSLTIEHIEVSQGIQDASNIVQLAASKLTAVRVYIKCTANCSYVTGQLKGYRENSPLPGSPLIPVNRFVLPTNTSFWQSQRGVIGASLNFLLPVDWTRGTISITVQAGTVTATLPLTFTEIAPPFVGVIPIHYNYQGAGLKPSEDVINNLNYWASMAYPVPVRIVRLPQINWELTCLGMEDCGAGYDVSKMSLLNLLNFWSTIYLLDRSVPTHATTFYGLTPQGLMGRGEADWIYKNIAYGDADLPYNLGQKIFAHELAHTMGRSHTKISDVRTCESPSPTMPSDWPSTYTNATIQQYGLDLWSNAFITNSPEAVISPSIYDYMSYCWVELDDQIGKTWTSPFTYHRLLEWMQARTSSSNVKGQLLAEQNYLLVSGLIFTDDTVQMDPAWIVSSTTPLQVPPSGTDYCLDAVDISDNVLYTTCFDLSFISNGTGNPMSVTGISASIPWADNAAKYVLRKGGNVLAARAVSSHSPSVSITSPSAGDAWLVDSIHTISWTSNDLDGDALTYTILYSPDGTQWLPLAAQYKQTSFQVKTSDLPGGANAQIRVLASDGLLTTRVDSSVFSVAKNVPKVWINTPSSNQTFTVGPPIVFQGAAYDMEDGSLYGSQLEWRVDGSPLGIGEQILTQLPPGVHQITLIATDQDGNHSSANINLTIDGSQIFLAYIRR